ncbi:hypothetical protein SEA_HOLLIDAY_77 [Gordonia phage Holliday]|nr:hypothetical protein SEA_HOLLIDAY_77 [Gordonia phage Holliday]
MIVYEAPERYRGTIEVYAQQAVAADQLPTFHPPAYETEWRWRCKSNNHTILASGQGYNRKAGALNAIDAQYSVKLTDEAAWSPGAQALVVPWRLLIRDRHGDITTTGAVY